jgi:hypothetical protein
MKPAALVAAIRDVVRELGDQPMLDVTDRVGGLMAQATTAGREATPLEQKQILAAFRELETAVARSLDRIADELRKAGTARTAMSGYGAIRPYTTAQRLRTRV